MGHARRSGFAVGGPGSRWGIWSAGPRWRDFILYKEDRFGGCEENGREGGRQAREWEAISPGPRGQLEGRRERGTALGPASHTTP